MDKPCSLRDEHTRSVGLFTVSLRLCLWSLSFALCLPATLSVCLCLSPSVSICLFVCLSLTLSVSLGLCLSVCLSPTLSPSLLSLSLSLSLSLLLSLSLSLSLSLKKYSISLIARATERRRRRRRRRRRNCCHNAKCTCLLSSVQLPWEHYPSRADRWLHQQSAVVGIS